MVEVGDVVEPLVIGAPGPDVELVTAVAATAGVPVRVRADPGAEWRTAPLVVVPASAVASCLGLARRTGVVVVTDGSIGEDQVWECATALGADHVVVLPAGERWLAQRFVECARPTGAGVVVAVTGSGGGAGASVLATALALTAARDGPALLVDGDPWGGGLDLLLGLEAAQGLRWPDLAGTVGRLPVEALAASLPRTGELTVLSWDRGDPIDVSAEAMAAVLAAGRAAAQIVVVDVPRSPTESGRVALQAADRAVLVLPATVRSVAGARRVLSWTAPLCRDLRVVVRGPAPSGLRGRDVAAALGVPVAATLRAEAGLAARLERGEPPGSSPGPLARTCVDLLAERAPAATMRAA